MITIIMAVYNGQEYIREQLESLKDQTYTEWRLVIRDDRSSDKTAEIVKKFSDEVEQEVIFKVNEKPSGSAKNNFALLINDAKESDYVMFCDQDDIWKKDKIEITFNKMKQAEERYGRDFPLLVHGDVEVIDENGNINADSMFEMSHINADSKLPQILIQNHVTGCTMMCNKKLIAGISEYASSEYIIMHDYLAALYASVFGKIEVIKKPLLSYRQHSGNSVGAKNNNNAVYLLKRLANGRKSYKEAMETSRNQVKFFVEIYREELAAEKYCKEYELMSGYASLGSRAKLYRIMFYKKNHIWKNGTIRKIMQVIWG
ncbi:glycosyltransferase family 2 protein [Clostridium sp. AM27-31LB]|uniref:glycosyltransferase family 2 protein n=1 Tax=Clostridium sp. AM27-31LB TaxID=2293026 RepID=UPI0011C22B15|nr:glycosyltransferase family 2 protein [Clostridium sp. AM27-31LB]